MQQYLEQLAQNSERLADAAAAGTDAPVPSCPGWTVTDLLDHCVRATTGRARSSSRERQGTPSACCRPTPTRRSRAKRWSPASGPRRRQLVDDARVGRAPTRRCGPSRRRTAPRRSGSGGGRRRPRCTATTPRSRPAPPRPIDAELAVDGIDEFLTVFLPRLADNFGPMGDGTVHLHCTDVDGEWLFARRDGEITVTAEHAKGDVAAGAARPTCCCSSGVGCPRASSRCSATPTCWSGSARGCRV